MFPNVLLRMREERHSWVLSLHYHGLITSPSLNKSVLYLKPWRSLPNTLITSSLGYQGIVGVMPGCGKRSEVEKKRGQGKPNMDSSWESRCKGDLQTTYVEQPRVPWSSESTSHATDSWVAHAPEPTGLREVWLALKTNSTTSGLSPCNPWGRLKWLQKTLRAYRMSRGKGPLQSLALYGPPHPSLSTTWYRS